MPTHRRAVRPSPGNTLSSGHGAAVDIVLKRVQTALEVDEEFRWALRWEPSPPRRPSIPRPKTIENIRRYRSVPWSHCYEKLVGAAYSLIQAARLIDVPHRGYEDQPRHELLGTLVSDGVTGDEADRAHAWTAGYYLGNAQARVAAVLDGLINCLLRLHVTYAHPSHQEEWFYLWVSGRLLFASELAETKDLKEELLRTHDEFITTGIDTTKAAAGLARYNRRHGPMDLSDALNMYPQKTKETFVPLCVARNNAFKHLPEGVATVGTRGQRARLREFGCTLVAFEALAKLWVLCLKEAIFVGDDGTRTRPPAIVRKKKPRDARAAKKNTEQSA